MNLSFLHKLSDTSMIGSNSLSRVHFNQSLSNTTTKILNQLFSWRKSRRVKAVMKNSNSFNNVCVIMKSEQSTRIFNQNSQHSMTECFHSQTSFTPAVSFINRGEGIVSMQLMDRIMINDNQLYSMALNDHQIGCNYECNDKSFKTSFDGTDDCRVEDNQWFCGSIERQKAIEMLMNCPIGSFVIRHSTTQTNCFALTLRVPNDYHWTGIAHYLVLTDRQTFKIKGFAKEFQSLESLVIHHSILKELLPCPLLLPNNKLNNRSHSRSYSDFLPNIELKNENFEEILVDVDSDPNYQKILINFRKTMSRMN